MLTAPSGMRLVSGDDEYCTEPRVYRGVQEASNTICLQTDPKVFGIELTFIFLNIAAILDMVWSLRVCKTNLMFFSYMFPLMYWRELLQQMGPFLVELDSYKRQHASEFVQLILQLNSISLSTAVIARPFRIAYTHFVW